MEKEIVIQTNHLTKRYRNKVVVNDLSINVHKGDIYGFVGKNGAGKTTLIRLLCGLVKPTSGDYSLFGSNDSKELLKCRKRIAAMVETPSLYYDMTAEDNLKTRCIALHKDFDLIIPRLKEVGLEDVINSKKKVKDFSLGMKQRLGIAVSILGEPDLLILDEPTNGLDPTGIKEVRELLVKLNEQKRITIFISSHILSELSKFATTYGFIDNGKVIKEISSEQLELASKKALFLKVTNKDDIKKIIDIINTNHSGLEVEAKDDSINIYGIDNIAPILKELYSNDIDIAYVKEQENGLEDFFLSLTKGE